MLQTHHNFIRTQFNAIVRRHPGWMLIVTLLLAVVATIVLLGRDVDTVILYKAF